MNSKVHNKDCVGRTFKHKVALCPYLKDWNLFGYISCLIILVPTLTFLLYFSQVREDRGATEDTAVPRDLDPRYRPGHRGPQTETQEHHKPLPE